MTKYPSEKGSIFIIAFVLVCLVSVFTLFQTPFTDLKIAFNVAQLIVLPVILLLLWMLFGTYYVIDGDQLNYHCAFIKGSIPITEIHQIIIQKSFSFYSGLKPALGNFGIVVKYNRWDDIYLSPRNKEAFIAELKKINPDIAVIG